ncbi:hypothetical protein MNB_SM-6-1410 [hydrothermal vent metagenome]|uniref:Uncharacterized protein n=1 Tax=hydrothermal vent metagenome TaxID=652676 RepID=A0A1W1C6J2_9ZZZZ
MPTLGMLVEAAAQSSSGITNDDVNGRVGFVVSLKNIKLLQKPKSTIYQIDIKIDYKVENLKYLSFSIINNESKTVASGSLVIALQ